eukprot:374035-Pelagomonas_calceolata.AAC.5
MCDVESARTPPIPCMSSRLSNDCMLPKLSMEAPDCMLLVVLNMGRSAAARCSSDSRGAPELALLASTGSSTTVYCGCAFTHVCVRACVSVCVCVYVCTRMRARRMGGCAHEHVCILFRNS